MLWCLTVLDCEIGLPCRMMAYVEYRDIYSSIDLFKSASIEAIQTLKIF